MKNSNNCLEIEKINSQLRKADIEKIRLIRNINIEYELYLKFVRDLLYISVEKGIHELCGDSLIENVSFNRNEFFCFFEKKISKLIYSKLPFLTIEQLKINEIDKNINKKNTFKSLENTIKTKYYQKEEIQYEEGFQFEKPVLFEANEDIFNTSEYYQVENYEKLVSLDLDKDAYLNNLSNKNMIENVELEKQFIFSLIELLDEIKVENSVHSENQNMTNVDIYSKYQSLKNFDLIDESLKNLLLNLSYNINLELFKANLIKKIISEDSFEYLVGKNLMIKHPRPFVINFEFNTHQSSSKSLKLPNIIFFNISTVELEFKNLNLSIQRNKINELKNQFQRLIKKETYWRQKEITLNKIR